MMHTQGSTPPARRRPAIGFVFGLLTAAAVVSLTVATPDGPGGAPVSVASAQVDHQATARPAPATPSGTGVPDAAKVFADRPEAVEEASPTF